MSAAERRPAAETSQNIEYTVRQTAKIHREKEQDPRSSVWLSVAKCIFGFFLFASVLTCLVASKISLLSMASFRRNTRDPKQNQETLFIMTVLVLMIPEGYSFLMACWTSLFSKSRKWPCKKAIIVGLISGLLEVFGLSFFTVVILLQTDIPPVLRIIMMNGVFVFPVLWQVYKRGPCFQQQYSLKEFLAFTLALILEIAGVAVLMYLVHKKSDKKVFWVIPVALLSISFAWCPKIFKVAIEPVTDQLPPGQRQSVSESVRVENLSGVSVSLPQGETIIGVATSSKSARGKAAVITSLWKLLLIPFVAVLFCNVYKIADLEKLSDGFSDFNVNHYAFPYFMVQIFTSFVGYMLGILACSMCMQFLAFAFPMALSTPLTFALAVINHDAQDDVLHFSNSDENEILLYVTGGCLLIAQFLSVGYYLFKGQDFIMAKESSLFWMPQYNGVLLEQHLLLNRRNKITDDYQINHRELVNNSCVYICTTMYHEIEQEMEQLLQSLHDIDCAREKSKRQIESHIFFDGAIKGDVLNNYVLQLISLIPKTLKVKIENCMKLKTPYGMQMRWRLPGGMFFHIHLKDNLRVKNKKRWSQVMYMSYVLDFKEKQMEVTDENTYILTTDADVRFTHESVEALLDLMARDPTVGAVCGRTHPLGVGPIVWYQVFDYAIGHWFQKVANHVLGSVLCSPGCFSVYRAAALRDVLPIYSSKVDNSFDFLTKDMGEDRWLCTLMVQSGWRLEYCAAAEDSTYCPDNFDEFFKQRRRWIPSTLANLILLISEWKLTVSNNDYISFGFILYQALMVFSTIISPSTVILIIASSLSYVHFIESTVLLVVLLSLVTVGYALICLYTSQEFQLKVAKLLTIFFSLIMAFVTVGLAAQAADDIYERQHPPTPTPTPTVAVPTAPGNLTLTSNGTGSTALSSTTGVPGDGLPADVSSLYLGGLIGVFIVAALLHPTEASCLLDGVWYLLCLPSGYLLLIVYSVCNMTDRSWGTREEKTKKVNDVPWYETLWRKIRYICTCCQPEPTQQTRDTSRVEGHGTDAVPSTSGEETSSSDNGLQASEDEGATRSVHGDDPGKESDAESPVTTDHTTKLLDEAPPKSALKHTPVRRQPSLTREGHKEDSGRFTKFRYPGDKKVTFATKLPRLNPETFVEDWLQRDFQQLYLNNFKDGGYDNVSFIAGMTDRDLKAIGIEKRGHRKRLLIEIEKLPQVEIAQEVPENVEDWLTELGLDEYWENFTQSGYTEPRMLEDLKIMNKETLKETFGIIKPGHLDKMYKAIQKVQYPSEAQRRIRRAREETNKLVVMDLKVDNQDLGHEYQFWEGLRQACLVPESAVFGAVEELKEKLEDLRDSALMVFAVANVIWMILILSLVRQKNLEVMGTNVLGFSFLCVYGFLIVIQFLTLLWHRGVTFTHVIARAPWRRGQLHRAWAFDDQNLPPPPDDRALQDIRNHRHRRPRRKSRELRRQMSQPSGSSEERENLLPDKRPQSTYGSRSLSRLV